MVFEVYYASMHSQYQQYISGNELLTIPAALDAVTTRTISLLATDVKTRKLVGVSRDKKPPNSTKNAGKMFGDGVQWAPAKGRSLSTRFLWTLPKTAQRKALLRPLFKCTSVDRGPQELSWRT